MGKKRILAIDYGGKRIGLAVSDPLGITAQGLPNIENNNNKFKALAQLIRNRDISKVIIGLPRKFDGSKGEAALNIEKFAKKLKALIKVRVIFRHEWLTTREANKVLINQDKSRKKRKAVIDRMSAQLILQGYLDSAQEGEDEA
jgi:putative Holliday junction resolvase